MKLWHNGTIPLTKYLQTRSKIQACENRLCVMVGLLTTQKGISCSQTSFKALFTWHLFREPFLCHLMKNCNLHHLILPILLPCLIFPLSLAQKIFQLFILFVVCLPVYWLSAKICSSFLLEHLPGFSAKNDTSLYLLWLGRTTLTDFSKGICNIDV